MAVESTKGNVRCEDRNIVTGGLLVWDEWEDFFLLNELKKRKHGRTTVLSNLTAADFSSMINGSHLFVFIDMIKFKEKLQEKHINKKKVIGY